MSISSFSGKYEFLSNFYPTDILYRGWDYRSVEHAYQAAKTLKLNERQLIQEAATPGKAKRLGKTVTLRPNWDGIKLEVMEHLLRQKFAPERHECCFCLVDTDPVELIEGNDWGDQFWGAMYNPSLRKWEGQNHMGKLLMKIRRELVANW